MFKIYLLPVRDSLTNIGHCMRPKLIHLNDEMARILKYIYNGDRIFDYSSDDSEQFFVEILI